MSNKHHTVFYVGITSNLEVRMQQHKGGESKFTAAYNIYELLYFEDYSDVKNAIAREKGLKEMEKRVEARTHQKRKPFDEGFGCWLVSVDH